jgi:hypothetical protein
LNESQSGPDCRIDTRFRSFLAGRKIQKEFYYC